MQKLTQKQKVNQQSTSNHSATPQNTFQTPDRSLLETHHLQQPVYQITQAGINITDEDNTTNGTSSNLAYDFKQLPLFHPLSKQIQPKLKVNIPNDRYEQEADLIADKIMRKTEAQPPNIYNDEGKHPNNQQRQSTQILAQYKAPKNTYQTVLPSDNTLLRSPGQTLQPGTRRFMEQRFGTNFSNVRTHTDSHAAEMNRSLNAQAFTFGNNIYYGRGKTPASNKLTAHELTHVLQQNTAGAASIQRTADQEDPNRYRTIHENLFVRAPSGGTLQQWVDPATGTPGTAQAIITQFKNRLQTLMAANPGAVGGTIRTNTTESAAETDAISVDQTIRNHFSHITTQLSESQIRSAIGILSSSQTSDPDFLREWLSNRLSMWTNVDDFNIQETDTRFQQMLNTLLADSFAGPHIRTLASRQAAFVETSGSTRNVFIHRGAPASLRRLILMHELTHFYAHQGFKNWVAATNAPRLYNEGFTEFLARQVMTSAQRQGRRSYNNHVQKIENQVARFVSVDDIANAYFKGQVWRLEGQSAVARQLFESQVGLREGAPRNTERSQSQTSQGIVQTVESGRHYRFMNLGVAQSQPKAEHVAFFQNIFSQIIQGHPNVQIRFIGHSSSPGSLSFNLQLSENRAREFYQMARNAGVTTSQLLDENNPPHQGEVSPTAENANVHGRSFNRRVELFIT